MVWGKFRQIPADGPHKKGGVQGRILAADDCVQHKLPGCRRCNIHAADHGADILLYGAILAFLFHGNAFPGKKVSDGPLGPLRDTGIVFQGYPAAQQAQVPELAAVFAALPDEDPGNTPPKCGMP